MIPDLSYVQAAALDRSSATAATPEGRPQARRTVQPGLMAGGSVVMMFARLLAGLTAKARPGGLTAP